MTMETTLHPQDNLDYRPKGPLQIAFERTLTPMTNEWEQAAEAREFQSRLAAKTRIENGSVLASPTTTPVEQVRIQRALDVLALAQTISADEDRPDEPVDDNVITHYETPNGHKPTTPHEMAKLYALRKLAHGDGEHYPRLFKGEQVRLTDIKREEPAVLPALEILLQEERVVGQWSLATAGNSEVILYMPTAALAAQQERNAAILANEENHKKKIQVEAFA